VAEKFDDDRAVVFAHSEVTRSRRSVARRYRESPPVRWMSSHQAYKASKMIEAKTEASTLAERLPSKIRTIQQELPAWIGRFVPGALVSG
jgi:hypothetical protein